MECTFKTVDVTVIASTLVSLVLLHERYKLLCRPSLSLEIVIVGSRGSSVHLDFVNTLYWKSEHIKPLTMKLIDEPPPRIWAHGTMALRPPSHSDGRDS